MAVFLYPTATFQQSVRPGSHGHFGRQVMLRRTVFVKKLNNKNNNNNKVKIFLVYRTQTIFFKIYFQIFYNLLTQNSTKISKMLSFFTYVQ